MSFGALLDVLARKERSTIHRLASTDPTPIPTGAQESLQVGYKTYYDFVVAHINIYLKILNDVQTWLSLCLNLRL